MRLSVNIDGDQALRAALDRLGDEVSALVGREVYRAGFELQNDIKQRIQRGPKTGRVYKRGGVLHQASAPGQAPATDTGRLVNSVYLDDEGIQSGRAQVSVGSLLAYARYLEYGTRHIAERPAWTPAAEMARRKFRDRLEAVVRRATQ
jgi:hypothetical protein